MTPRLDPTLSHKMTTLFLEKQKKQNELLLAIPGNYRYTSSRCRWLNISTPYAYKKRSGNSAQSGNLKQFDPGFNFYPRVEQAE